MYQDLILDVDIPEGLEELIPGYLKRRNEDLEVLQKLFTDGRYIEIAKIAHKVKGSAAGYGFTSLSSLAKELDTASKNSNKDSVDISIKKIKYYLENIKIRKSK